MSETLHRLPPWVAGASRSLAAGDALKRRLRSQGLVTVCEEARCPNLGECFGRGTATFMLLGERCTRRCSFCSVETGRPSAPDPQEPRRVAETAAGLGLRYVVITSVARDDLADEGAGQFVATVVELRRAIDGVEVEVLVPDLGGRSELISRVLEAGPEVFGHNIETVERLSPEVRGRASYRRSLEVLALAARSGSPSLVKTGIMAGLGETRTELARTMADVAATGCRLLTVGQYLRPTRQNRPVARYLEPSEFEEIAQEARQLGFEEVAAGPLVRSSYRAESLYRSGARHEVSVQ